MWKKYGYGNMPDYSEPLNKARVRGTDRSQSKICTQLLTSPKLTTNILWLEALSIIIIKKQLNSTYFVCYMCYRLYS